MKILFAHILIILLLISCIEKKEQNEALDGVMSVEELVIPESDVLNLKSYFLTASYKKQLYGYNRKEHTLDNFDLRSLSTRQIQLEPEGPDAIVGDIRALFVSSPDSIWACDDALHILLIDAQGDVRRSLNISDYLHEGESPVIERNHAMATAQFYYDSLKDCLLFGIRYRNDSRSGFMVREVSLEDGECRDFELSNSLSVPDVANGIYANMSKPNITFAKGKIVYNYPVESHVYVIDTRTAERSVVEADSRYSWNVAGKCRDMSDYNEWDRHGIENPHFFEVMYMSDLNMYARLHLCEHELSAESDLTKVNDDRDLCLTLFDDDFQVLHEVKLPPHRYSYYTGWCAFSDGFCIFVDNSLYDATKSEELVLDYYKGIVKE